MLEIIENILLIILVFAGVIAIHCYINIVVIKKLFNDKEG